MTKYKERKKLEEMATLLTGIEPISGFEYVSLTYSKPRKGVTKQHKINYFNSNKRII